jgi:hypothetical protein
MVASFAIRPQELARNAGHPPNLEARAPQKLGVMSGGDRCLDTIEAEYRGDGDAKLGGENLSNQMATECSGGPIAA